MTAEEIERRLIENDALFNNILVIEQDFDIIPRDKPHLGASITFQDIRPLRKSFLEQLVDTVVDWVYGSEKYKELRDQFKKSGKSDAAAASEIIRKASQKFRKSDDTLLAQGQLGELLLFHFIQRYKKAIPILRKMPITTSSAHERYGADAIHYKIENGKNIIILGEAKAYTSKYKFGAAFEDAVKSILSTYDGIRDEMNLYLHEDFLDKEVDAVAEAFLSNTLPNVEMNRVCLVMYSENERIILNSENEIKEQIERIIEQRYNSFDNGKIDIENNPILKRVTYIVFPVWEFDALAKEFQDML